MRAAVTGDGTLFRWRTRVYWEDTDAGGVVYHARYLHFLERARTEWMRAAGLGQQAMRDAHGVVFVVRDLSIAYDKPARLDDELEMTVNMSRQRAASFDIEQAVLRVADGVTLARSQVKAACLNALDWTPCRMPAPIADAIRKGITPA